MNCIKVCFVIELIRSLYLCSRYFASTFGLYLWSYPQLSSQWAHVDSCKMWRAEFLEVFGSNAVSSRQMCFRPRCQSKESSLFESRSRRHPGGRHPTPPQATPACQIREHDFLVYHAIRDNFYPYQQNENDFSPPPVLHSERTWFFDIPCNSEQLFWASWNGKEIGLSPPPSKSKKLVLMLQTVLNNYKPHPHTKWKSEKSQHFVQFWATYPPLLLFPALSQPMKEDHHSAFHFLLSNFPPPPPAEMGIWRSFATSTLKSNMQFSALKTRNLPCPVHVSSNLLLGLNAGKRPCFHCLPLHSGFVHQLLNIQVTVLRARTVSGWNC